MQLFIFLSKNKNNTYKQTETKQDSNIQMNKEVVLSRLIPRGGKNKTHYPHFWKQFCVQGTKPLPSSTSKYICLENKHPEHDQGKIS